MEGMHKPGWCGKPVCGAGCLDSCKLGAVTSPGFVSVSLASLWEFCTSRKGGIGLWVCRPACAAAVALPDAASAQVHGHGCGVGVEGIQSRA